MIELIGGIAVTVIGGLILYLVTKNYRGTVFIKRIWHKHAEAIEDIMELQKDILDYNVRDPIDGIFRWLKEYESDKEAKEVEWEPILLAAKWNRKIVGFLYTECHFKAQMLYISTYGIKTGHPEATRRAGLRLLKRLNDIVQRNIPECNGIVFEVNEGNESMTLEQIDRAKRLKIHYKNRARRNFTTKAYEIDFDYTQPRLSLNESEGYQEQKVRLMYVPLTSTRPISQMARNEFIEILRFLYLDVYGSSFEAHSKVGEEYFRYMSSLFLRESSRVPDFVALRDC